MTGEALPDVRLTIEDGVAEIVLIAADRRNALTVQMAEEMVDACERVDADASVGAVLIRAEGPSFCAGAHRSLLTASAEAPVDDSALADLTAVYRSFSRVGALEPPSIAVVCGSAVGAGVNLALAPDLLVMAEDAKLISGFLRIGLHPGGGHFTLIGRAAGRQAAAAMALFGDDLDGRAAADAGVAWRALPATDAEAYARKLAKRVAQDPELARAAAATMRMELGPPSVPWPIALRAEMATQLWSLPRALASGRLA